MKAWFYLCDRPLAKLAEEDRSKPALLVEGVSTGNYPTKSRFFQE